MIIEDIGGSGKNGTSARRPNSFVYRCVPVKPGDLEHGKLQALQVLNASGDPITFESQAALNSPDQVALHTYGKTHKPRRSSRRRTACSSRAPVSARSSSTRPATRTPAARRTRRLAAAVRS
jgi:hypothetical protein